MRHCHPFICNLLLAPSGADHGRFKAAQLAVIRMGGAVVLQTGTGRMVHLDELFGGQSAIDELGSYGLVRLVVADSDGRVEPG